MVAAAAPVASFLSETLQEAISAWAIAHVFAPSQRSTAAIFGAAISFG
jgi:hypothetical protein